MDGNEGERTAIASQIMISPNLAPLVLRQPICLAVSKIHQKTSFAAATTSMMRNGHLSQTMPLRKLVAVVSQQDSEHGHRLDIANICESILLDSLTHMIHMIPI